MPTPTLKLLYNPGEYVPSPIAPEGVPTVADTATMEDLSPGTKALLGRNEQRVKERNQREYEEHRRNTDVRFTGEKPLQTEMASGIADVSYRTPYSTNGKPWWYLANKAREQALFDANPEAKYIMRDVVKNNIFSENDLLEPLDAHIGNFMYGKDGVLRATDIHKQGGKIK